MKFQIKCNTLFKRNINNTAWGSVTNIFGPQTFINTCAKNFCTNKSIDYSECKKKYPSILTEGSEPKTSINSNEKKPEVSHFEIVTRIDYLESLAFFLARADKDIVNLRLLDELPDFPSRSHIYEYFRTKLLALEDIKSIHETDSEFTGFDYKVETSFEQIESSLEKMCDRTDDEKLTFFRDILVSDFQKIIDKFKNIYAKEIAYDFQSGL